MRIAILTAVAVITSFAAETRDKKKPASGPVPPPLNQPGNIHPGPIPPITPQPIPGEGERTRAQDKEDRKPQKKKPEPPQKPPQKNDK